MAGAPWEVLDALSDGSPPPPAAGADKYALDNFPLDDSLKRLLNDRGIQSLFPIQALALPPALEGKDLVGRARTGCGKTLAFTLPIIQQFIDKGETGAKKAYGRHPAVIVLAPTRELAKQVHEDFNIMGRAANLATLCIYGGAPISPQESALRRGVDVVVGTPGRVKDHLDRGSLVLDKLRFRVLDECDEMLNMGFAEDVEYILAHQSVDAATSVQTMLFSATMPSWVKEMSKKYLQAGNQEYVDLVGDQKMKASTSVRHLLLPCLRTQTPSLVTDLVRCYGCQGRTIVFTDTKNDANDLAQQLSETVGARALHGDIAQAQREATLKGFKSGVFSVLVATDVAARGLDITGVELVVQTAPPKDHETYIHRSGRTGRANSTGISITLVTRSREENVVRIEKRAGLKFERIGAPQPEDMAQIAAQRSVEAIEAVDKELIPMFKGAAERLLSDLSMEPAEVLALALAKITGHTAMKRRSLLTSADEYTTVQFRSKFVMERPGACFGFLRRRLGEEFGEKMCSQIKRMMLTKDGTGAVFDVPVGECGLDRLT
ncbi:unnamed protein product [Pedinophyceae sp. YPF-701]|nr:unnamed protein product [Pedinophyceae sp. YPF-701]